MTREQTLAIARLEDGNPTRHLREHYPELRFLFDRFDGQAETLEETVPLGDYTAMEDRAQEAEWTLTRISDFTVHSDLSPRERLDEIRTIIEEQ